MKKKKNFNEQTTGTKIYDSAETNRKQKEKKNKQSSNQSLTPSLNKSGSKQTNTQSDERQTSAELQHWLHFMVSVSRDSLSYDISQL